MLAAAPSVSSDAAGARAEDPPRPLRRWLERRSMRLAVLVLIAVVVFLQYRLWVGQGSLAELHGLQQEIVAQKADLERLRARNDELKAEVADLQNGEAALEERARDELGMIKPGEAFIQAIEHPKPPPSPDSVAARPAARGK